MSGYLAKYGLTLVRNGYNIIPLKPSEKIPAIEGWRETQATEKHVRKWCSNGLAEAGIGITTGVIVFLDLDIPNKVVKKLVRWAEENLGHAPARIGNPPKIGLLYRSESAIPTRLSKVYRDEQGQRCQIEILGESRQFVACAIHPVTGRPYTWDKGFNPLAVRAEDLPVVRAADVFRIFDEFDRVAAEEGWIPASGRLPALTRNARDPDDIWNPKKPPCGYSEEKISEILMSIPNDSRFDAREDWLKIGCAVHHETDGSEFGRELWYEWSFQHPSHDNALFDKAWDSFGMHAEDPEYAEITFRYIAKIANLIAKKVAQKKLHDLLFDIEATTDFDNLKKFATAVSLIKDLDPLDRERLVSAIQKTARRLGTPLGIRIIREMIRYRETEIETPEWLAGWVFLTHTGQFYHRLTGQYVESSAFDKAFGRYVAHGTTPTWFATRVVKIPVYHMTMYLPGAEGTFRDASGVEWINTYRDTAPPIPNEYSEQDIQNIRIVKNHALHLFGEDQQRDIDILHSILAYIVQTGKRVNWITAIQGAEKIGKTFYAYLLSSVLGGAPHIHMLDTETLTNSSFTEWAQGHQVIYIEELKVHGRRYDVMDKLKPYITNESVSIHPKGKPQYNAVNTTTYLAFTNYRNAVPVGEGDTRYFILLSHWQKEVEVKKFKAGNPDYYNRLFAALHQSPGALRRWLMEYELHPDFDPVARAPHSEGKLRIIDEAKSELQTQIEDLIDAGDVVGVSKNFIVVHLLRNAVADESGALPPQQSIQSILQRLQYTPIKGRRVKITDTKQGLRQDFYCWSDDPEILRMDQQEVRAILEREILARLSPGLG